MSTMNDRVLVVDDDRAIRESLARALQLDGYDVQMAPDGAAALAAIRAARPDVAIVDVMMPNIDGLTLCRVLRAEKDRLPILMLTARTETADRVAGLDAGADDYLPKPFELAILLARIKGLLRRHRWNEQGSAPAPESQPDVYTFAGRTLDFSAMEVRAKGHSYRLTQMECELLRYLVRNAGHAVSRRTILEQVWGLHEDTDTRAIDNFVVRLRRYLEDRPSSPNFLLTVRGVGYKFVPQ
jgi:DNA-binding response OmpR family regulator